MKLLIFTQAVDLDDPVLGFFHGWLEALAPHCAELSVICLKEGRHTLPNNVSVYSLGKERGESHAKYIARFYWYIWVLRNKYQAVFVHMNQEYVLMGGVYWWFSRKRVYLWRNFPTGNFFTPIAVFLSTKVFCTSKFSYTNRFKKTVLMPVGIDTDRFTPNPSARKVNHILSLGRIAPIKRLDVFIEALGLLSKQNVSYVTHIVGDPLPQDTAYLEQLKKRVAVLGIAEQVIFYPGVPNRETTDVYRAHDIFVNLTPSGSYDKTIYEAAACACLVVASISDWENTVDSRLSFDGSADSLARTLTALLGLSQEEKDRLRVQCTTKAHQQSLYNLTDKLVEEMV